MTDEETRLDQLQRDCKELATHVMLRVQTAASGNETEFRNQVRSQTEFGNEENAGVGPSACSAIAQFRQLS